MKCIDCNGTGLESEAKLCQSCQGFGVIGTENETVEEIEEESAQLSEPEAFSPSDVEPEASVVVEGTNSEVAPTEIVEDTEDAPVEINSSVE